MALYKKLASAVATGLIIVHKHTIQAKLMLAALVAMVGLAAAPAMQASAATIQGICATNVGAKNSYCLRQGGADLGNDKFAVDIWNRDISGDSNQQFELYYQGAVSTNGGWPFTDYGLDQAYHGNAVYKIEDGYSDCMSAAVNQNKVGMDYNCQASGELWVWGGSGVLVNVYQSDYYGSSQYLMSPSDYQGTYTQGTSNPTKWDTVNPS